MMFFSKRAEEAETVPPQDTVAGAVNLAKGRLYLVALFFFLGYLAITLRLVDLTLIKPLLRGDTPVAAVKEGVKVLEKPLRGTILDRNGELIATSLKMASLFANPHLVIDPKKTARDLAEILADENVADLEKKLSLSKKFVWIKRNLTPRQQYAINALGEPGLGFQEEDRRIYPGGALAAHVTGYTDVDGKGIAGIEKAADRLLADGEEPVTTTIDLRIQHVMHKELTEAMRKFSAKAAIGMVMDVNKGDIIALVSLPDFDPHHPAGSSGDATFNRATLGVFEMGSTFKVFSTAAALDSGLVNFNTTYDATTPLRYGRFSISDYHGKNRAMTVPEIFIHSSNIGTGKMVETIGSDRLRQFYEELGFFAPVPTDFPEKGTPLYPKKWRDIHTITASFGHGLAVSPLHVMQAVSAIVNGGVMIRPRFIKGEDDNSLSLHPVGTRIMKPMTSRQMLQLMELVVADGTGANAYVEGYHVGGKTGTAEKISGRGYNQKSLLSSFIGVFPVTNPRYAVLAIIDEPQGTKESYGYATGGWTAAPVVSKVIAQMGPLYQIPPDFDTARDITAEMAPYLREKKKKGGSVAAVKTDE